MPESARAAFDLTPLGRLGAALTIALLSGTEAAILSAPATFYLGKPAKPTGEFAGTAAFGEILVVAAVVALIVFVVMFLFVITRRKTAVWIRALSWTLTAAVAVVVVTLLIGYLRDGILWAIGASATVLVIGLVRVFRLGAAMNHGI
jgi:type IV secretory pathway VirB6-like protein